ncbi:MAG: anti-sigma factor domain-containing protein [Firmicutes bacterium]|nr:anti-sigma factor domain-containing protein [Bacillota bacterium]
MRNKGVVVEIAPKNKVIIMTSQGEFIKVPLRKHVQVGQEIRYNPKKERLSPWQLGFAATLFLALLGSWPFVSEKLLPLPVAPAFVLTLELNPSLEMQISADQKVLAVEGLNRDGKELVSRLDVVGDDLRSALTRIANKAQMDGFVKQQGQQVVVTIASQQDQITTIQERRGGSYNELEQIIVDALSTTKLADVRIWHVPRSLQTEAKLAGIIPSRYIAIQMPETPVIPQKIETRLTMADPPEIEEVVRPLVRTSLGQRNVEPARPSLTPARWTRQATETIGTNTYNVSFPIAAVKGDF